MRDATTVKYRIDARNSLVFVNEAWTAEAQAVPQPSLAPASVVGRGLWDLITDLPLQHLFDGLFYRLRTQQAPQVTYRFRCDTPDARRLHHLTIRPLADLSLEFQTKIIAIHERPRAHLLDPSVPRSRDLLLVCSWCKRIAPTDRGWLEVEEAIADLPGLDTGPLPALTHGMCPACESAMLRLLADPAASGPDTTTFGDWHSA